jgi:hypothetical protein
MRSIGIVAIAAAIACGGEAPVARAPSGPTERLYRPPADGRLTEAQVQAFVARLRAPKAAAREADEGASPDGRRATDEDLWVRQKVLEARMRIDERTAARREAEIDRKTAEALRGAAASSTDPATRDSIAKQIADLERRAAEREKDARKPGDPAENVNDALVARYRREMGPEPPSAP